MGRGDFIDSARIFLVRIQNSLKRSPTKGGNESPALFTQPPIRNSLNSSSSLSDQSTPEIIPFYSINQVNITLYSVSESNPLEIEGRNFQGIYFGEGFCLQLSLNDPISSEVLVTLFSNKINCLAFCFENSRFCDPQAPPF